MGKEEARRAHKLPAADGRERRHRAQAAAISCLDNFPKVMLTPHVHLQFTLIDLPESEPLNSVS